MNGCDSGFEGLNCTYGELIINISQTGLKYIVKIVFSFLFNSECDDKHYGPNCNEMCNSTCNSCNKSTGICDNGCHAGWRGLFCQEGR